MVRVGLGVVGGEHHEQLLMQKHPDRIMFFDLMAVALKQYMANALSTTQDPIHTGMLSLCKHLALQSRHGQSLNYWGMGSLSIIVEVGVGGMGSIFEHCCCM